MANEITLDFSRFEARVAAIEKRMLQMEAFLGAALSPMFGNEAVVATLVEQLGKEKAEMLVQRATAYVEMLQARFGGGSG